MHRFTAFAMPELSSPTQPRALRQPQLGRSRRQHSETRVAGQARLSRTACAAALPDLIAPSM